MGFGLIFAGLVFFFNPCIHIIDVFPDFFGAILISFGLRNLADVEDRFFEARKYARIMIAVYALKMFASLYVTARWHDGLLPVTFAFAVGEMILSFCFFNSLYGGIEYMANLHGGDKHLPGIGKVLAFSLIFSVIKNVSAFIPEAFALEKEPELDLSYNAKPVFTLTDAKSYAVMFFMVAVLALGIYYLVVTAKFYRGLWRDKSFNDELLQIYRERILENPHLINRRAFRRYFFIMMLATVFLIEFSIDTVCITPSVIAYILIYAASYSLEKKGLARRRAILIPLCIISIASTAFSSICGAGVNHIMDYESYISYRVDMIYDGSAAIIQLILSVCEAWLFVAFMAVQVRDVSRCYTELCGKPFFTAGSVVYPSIISAAAIGVKLSPIMKAKYYGDYINDTLVNARCQKISEVWELAQGWFVIVLLVSVLMFFVYISTLCRKADSELAPSEYI